MAQARIRNAWLAFAAVCIACYFAASSSALLQTVVWNLLAVCCAATVIFTILTRRVWARSAWTCITVAIGLLMLSNVTRNPDPYAQTGSRVAITVVIYLILFTMLIAAAVVFVNRHRRNVNDVTGMLDTAIVFVAASMISTEYLIYPFWADAQLGGPQLAILMIFNAINVFLLALTVRLWFSTDRFVNRSLRLMSVGLAVMSIVGILGVMWHLPRAILPYDTSSTLTAAGCMVFFGLVGASILDPTAARPPAVDVDAAVAARTRVLFLMVLCVLVPPVLLLFSSQSGDGFAGSRYFVVLTLILTGLLSYRVNLIIKGYREAVRREHILREINAGLMRATDLSEVNNRLSDWAGRLIEQPEITCILGTNEELAAAGLGPHGGRIRLPNGSLRWRNVIPIPGSAPARRLVVDSSEIVSGPAQASLAVLGQSLGMALERLHLSRRAAERTASERLQLLLHNASDVIALVSDGDGEENERYRIRLITDAIENLSGQTPPDVTGAPWPRLFHDSALARGLLERAKAEGEAHGVLVINSNPNALPITRPGAERKPDRRVDVNVAWLEPDRQFVVTHHDITDSYNLEQKLSYQAYHDELTGLNNRAIFREEIARAAGRSKRTGNPFAVLMIDLDDFKEVNDSLGHPAGDELLRAVARRLLECMREGDTPARLGGDEFAAILESAGSTDDAFHVAERILQRLSEPVLLADGEMVVTGASIGIALSDGSADPADTERDADIALYDAKFAGKGRIAVFKSDMHETAVERLSLNTQIRSALDRDEIKVNYQPIVNLKSGAVVGAEALVRWKHPTRGELPPSTFIGLAEQNGSIVDIGRFVIETSLRDLARWSKHCPKHESSRLSINISGRQLLSDNVAQVLKVALHRTGVDPKRVVVEVTESVLLPDEGIAAAQLREIAELGVSVIIDDFGTGWASLHYLRALPVRGLKLAQEFVSGLPNDFDFGLAQAIRDLSLSMSLSEVIAEGIETEAQKQALVAMGYELGQGYLLYQPLDFNEFVKVLKSTPPGVWGIGQRTDYQARGASDPLTERIIVPEQLSFRQRRKE